MKRLLMLTLTTAALTLSACGKTEAPKVDTAAAAVMSAADKMAMAAALGLQSDAMSARNVYRNPAATFEFFGVTPGMKVAEALPGGNYDSAWYTNVLVPYIGETGHVTGIDYAADMYPLFGFFSPEAIEAKKTWAADFTASVEAGKPSSGASFDAFTFADVPDEASGSYDAVLFIRALHNLSRFEDQGGYLTSAIASAHSLLKPGGIVGVVQHRAPETAAEGSVNGSRGYVKQSHIIAAFEAAGFALAGTSEINANAADIPSDKDIVWRLPPSLSTSRDNPDQATAYKAIGESDRMTLKFVKK